MTGYDDRMTSFNFVLGKTLEYPPPPPRTSYSLTYSKPHTPVMNLEILPTTCPTSPAENHTTFSPSEKDVEYSWVESIRSEPPMEIHNNVRELIPPPPERGRGVVKSRREDSDGSALIPLPCSRPSRVY